MSATTAAVVAGVAAGASVVAASPRPVLASSAGRGIAASGALAGLGALALAFGVPVALVTGAVVAAIARARAVAERERGTEAGRVAVLVLCAALVAELRAGRAAPAAFAVAAERLPASLPLAARERTHEAIERGDVEAALRLAGRSPPLSGLLRLATCWSVAAPAGAGLADAVDRLAAGLRADAESRREARVALAAPRATVRLLAGLPLLGVALGTAMGADPLAFLIRQPAGWACVAVALLLDAAGVLLLRRLLRAALPMGGLF